MRKLNYLLLSVLVLLAACAKDTFNPSDPNQGEITTITVGLDNGVNTRGANHADPAMTGMRTKLFVMYGEKLVQVVEPETAFGGDFSDGKPATFKVRLVSGQKYDLFCWADFGADYYTLPLLNQTEDVANPKIKMANTVLGTKGVTPNKYDAYSNLTKDVTLESAKTLDPIKLTRPFGLVRVVTTDAHLEAVVNADLTPVTYSTTFTDTYTALQMSDNQAVDPQNVTITDAAVGEDLGAGKFELSYDYLFANDNNTNLGFTVNYKATNGEVIDYAFTSIPYKRNYKTNITGNILTKQGSVNVTVDQAWDGQLPEGQRISNVTDLNAYMAANNNATIILEGSVGSFTVPTGKTFKFIGMGVAEVGQVTVSGASVEFDGLHFISSENGIHTTGGSNIVVKNSKFDITPNNANNNTGIMTWAWAPSGANGNITIENNTFNMHGMRGIQLRQFTTATIKGNTFNLDSDSNYAIQLDETNSEVIIEGNTFNNSIMGIYVHTNAINSKITAQNNTYKNVSFPFAVRPKAANANGNTIVGDFGYWLGGATINDATYGLNSVPNNGVVYISTNITSTVSLPSDKNLTFLGANNGINAVNGTRVKEIVISAPFVYQHSIATTGNFVFDGFTFVDKGAINVGKADGANLTFINNIVKDLTIAQTFFATPSGYGNYVMADVVVKNNKVDGAGLTGANTCGFRIWKVANATFVGNHFTNFSHSAAQFDNVTGTVTLNDNTFEGCNNFKFRAQVPNIGKIDSGNNENDLTRKP